MDTGNTIFMASVVVAFLATGLMGWAIIGVGVRDRRMAAQIETANLERAMKAMGEADDGRS